MNKTLVAFSKSLLGEITDSSYENICNNKIYEILRKYKILHYDHNKSNFANIKYVDLGYFTNEMRKFKEENERNVVYITSKGEEWLIAKLVLYGYIEFKESETIYKECSLKWVFENLDDDKYNVQYSLNGTDWLRITLKNTSLSTIIKCYKSKAQFRYSIK